MSAKRICPDIYHPAVARDGLLTRLRIPGGILNQAQCQAIVSFLESTGINDLQVTNRANLQIRGLSKDIEPLILQSLITAGLVAANQAVDGIRNIMASPIAGIDRTEVIDVRPFVVAWDRYLSLHPELGVLSNKFSVGFDGGGSVSIVDRPNDLTLLAVSENEFLLHLPMGGRIKLRVDDCISVLGMIAGAYLAAVGENKLRLREVMAVVEGDLLRWGVCLQRRTEGSPKGTQETVYRHLGVSAQKQAGLSYLGVVLPLGRLNLWQLSGLSKIASQYGGGTIRLTPWQNMIVPDVRDQDVIIVQQLIEALGLAVGAHQINGLLTACAGVSGCQFAATDTQADALAISAYLASRFDLDMPLNIHLSGCDKSCAQHYQADIALWGCEKSPERSAGYRLCIGGGDERFGRELSNYLRLDHVSGSIEHLIHFYHKQRASPTESFRTFTARQSLAQLQQVLHVI